MNRTCAALLLLTGCGRIGFEPMPVPAAQGRDGGRFLDSSWGSGGSPAGDARPGTGGASGGSFSGEGGKDEPGVDGGRGSDSGAPAPDDAGPLWEGGPHPGVSTCGGTRTSALWTFDRDLGGWSYESGNANPGSLSEGPGGVAVFDTGGYAPDAGGVYGWINPPSSPSDIDGMIVFARVRLEQGDGPVYAKAYAQSGPDPFSWVDGGVTELVAGQWTCLRLTVSAPASSLPDFNPKAVLYVGVEFSAPWTARVSVDEFGYGPP